MFWLCKSESAVSLQIYLVEVGGWDLIALLIISGSPIRVIEANRGPPTLKTVFWIKYHILEAFFYLCFCLLFLFWIRALEEPCLLPRSEGHVALACMTSDISVSVRIIALSLGQQRELCAWFWIEIVLLFEFTDPFSVVGFILNQDYLFVIMSFT